MNWNDLQKYYSLEGQTAVITGGFTGLGLAITRCLTAAGAKAAVISRRPPEPEILSELEGKAFFYPFDITETEHSQEIAEKIREEMGPCSILVNNAGNHCKKYIWDMSVEDYTRVLNVHLTGAFALTKAFLPQMREASFGRILFLASMTSYIGQPQVCGYATAKAGILGLVHTLAAETAPFGVTVNAIAPGWIDTPMFRHATSQDPARLQKITGRIPAGKIGSPADIGLCAAFLCSKAAGYINGACIPVDGGALIGF